MNKCKTPIILLTFIALFGVLTTGQGHAIAEDVIWQEIQRQRAVEAVQTKVQKNKRVLESDKSAEQLIAQYGGELTSIGIKLDSIQQRIDAALQATGQKRSKYGIWSEAKGYLDFSPGNGGNPRIFNAIRFRPLGDPNTRAGFMLYLQNGLGTTSYDTLTVSADEFYISTRFNLQNQQPVSLLVGNFWYSGSHFVISRPFRAEDTNKESRRSFNGISVDTTLFGLRWRGFLARTADGNGTGFDRYFFYNYATTPIAGGEAGLVLMKVTDDLKSANKTQGAYDATTVGLNLRRGGRLLGASYSISGEANFCRLDPDVLGGPVATLEYAARFDGKWNFKVPLAFNYYIISDLYPTQYTAIQTISDDFIYQYEENPWEPYYISNLKRWEWKVENLQIGNYAKASFAWNHGRELTGKNRSFGYKGFELNMDLAWLPLNFIRAGSLGLRAGEYETKISAQNEVTQELRGVDLTRRLGGGNL